MVPAEAENLHANVADQTESQIRFSSSRTPAAAIAQIFWLLVLYTRHTLYDIHI
jgi:hypothetical protein